MPHFKKIDFWAVSSADDQASLEDADPEEDAFERTARSVGELYSEALSLLDLHGPRSEMCMFVGHDPDGAEVKVSVSTDTSGSYESAGVRLPSGVARLPASERQLLVLEVVHGAVLRLAEARGWDPRRLDEARNHVVERDFEFRWDGPWKTSPDRRHRARARYRLPDSGYGRAWIEVTTRDGDPVVESGTALAFNTSDSFKRSARTLRWDGSSAVQLIPFDGPSLRAVHGLVRLEEQTSGWVSFADDGMKAGTPAAALSADPPIGGSGRRPPVAVRADGAHEPESPTRIRIVGGGPTNDVPDAYLHRLDELLQDFSGPEGQQWWLGAGIKELVVRYDLSEDKPRIRTRLREDTLRAYIQRNAPGLAYVPDPGIIARRDVEKLVAAVRRRTGLGPHPLLAG